MIKVMGSFNRNLDYLAKVLPPIKYSRDGDDVSLVVELGEVFYTEGKITHTSLDFKNFLNINGALLSYITNTLMLGNKSTSYNQKNYINDAFTWASTKQGHAYWEDLYYRWKSHINQ